MATNQTLQVRLSPTLRGQLEREASRKGIKATELIRHLIASTCGKEER
jgi:hypothetical protein